MPLDRTIQDAVTRIAQEHDVSLSQARRMLQEQIDLARRILVRDRTRSSVEISNDGIHSRIANKTIRPENPMRIFVSVGEAPKPTPKPITEKQRQALLVHKMNRATPVSEEPVESPVLDDFTRRDTQKRELAITGSLEKLPAPGTLTSIILGELRNPDHDFNQAFYALRGMGTRFDHLDTSALKKRMHTVATRYGIPIWHRHSDSQRP